MSTNQAFLIVLSLLPPTGILSGIINAYAVNGIANFYNLSINSSGSFQIIATYPNMIKGMSNTIILSPQAITTITLTANTTSPSANFKFILNATVLDQRNRLFTNAATLTLTTANSIIGSHTITNDTGIILFQLYGNIPGNYQITASSGIITSNNITLIISPNTLKFIQISPMVKNI